MELLTQEEIKEKGYTAVGNIVEKYYMNIPKVVIDTKAIKRRMRLYPNIHLTYHEQLALNEYPMPVYEYNGKYGSGIRKTDNSIIFADVFTVYRGIAYHIIYNNFRNRNPNVAVWCKLPIKRKRVATYQKQKKVFKIETEEKTAVFMTDASMKPFLPVNNPKFSIDKNLISYILKIRLFDSGKFYDDVAKQALKVLEEM